MSANKYGKLKEILMTEFENIMTGNVKEMLQVARILKENLKINENFKKKK